MSSIQEIEQAIRQLSPDDLAAFRSWFIEFDASFWDSRLENDVVAGKLDKLAGEALLDLREGRCTDLSTTEQLPGSGSATGNCPKRFSNWQTDAMRR